MCKKLTETLEKARRKGKIIRLRLSTNGKAVSVIDGKKFKANTLHEAADLAFKSIVKSKGMPADETAQ